MAYSYDLTTNRGKARFKIGDSIKGKGPRPDGTNYSDEEVDFFLSEGGTVDGAAVKAFETLASEWTAYSISESEGEVSYDAKEVADKYNARAADLDSRKNATLHVF